MWHRWNSGKACDICKYLLPSLKKLCRDQAEAPRYRFKYWLYLRLLGVWFCIGKGGCGAQAEANGFFQLGGVRSVPRCSTSSVLLTECYYLF